MIIYEISFITDLKSEHIKKEEELSFKAGELVGVLYDAFSKQYRDLLCWDAISVSQYFDYVRDKSSFPYQPINDLRQIEIALENKYKENGIDGLYAISDYWIGEMEKYTMRYNKEESQAIAKVMLSFWERLPRSNDSFENEYIAFVKEKLNCYI